MKLAKIFAIIFFIVSFWNLRDYGINWDEPIHWYRGQAYLHYFLTGQQTYDGMPKIAEHQRTQVGVDRTKEGYISVKDFRRSYYQDDSLTTKYWLIHDAGHPPLNGILASLTNYIFYQKLGILEDIESLHLFNLLASTLLIFVVVSFTYDLTKNKAAAIVAGLTLWFYPLFFAESHFNIKDPPVAAFFAATIWTFWRSAKNFSYKWLLLSSICFALALGTKFNALFIPVTLLPWILIYWRRQKLKLKKIPRNYLIALAAFPLIAGGIFLTAWPFLWSDPVGNFLEIVQYYKEIGTGTDYQGSFLTLGPINLYPLYWVLITTPPVTLFLTAVGVFASIWQYKKNKDYLLILIWFLIPILRVSLPNVTIYGGIRQIFEFIPAMAIVSGIGFYEIMQSRRKTLIGIVVAGIMYSGFVNYKMHPNQNVYFNQFVGGLAGASEKNVPYWGNSFGNAYWQALQWLNGNSEPNAKLALVQGTGLNMPQMHLRPDIQYWNNYWSGIDAQGEYLLELTHHDPVIVYHYAWEYVNKFLNPVYEVKVDGVAIAKLWKNDLEHTKPEYKLPEVEHKIKSVQVNGNSLLIDLGKKVEVTRLSVEFKQNASCTSVLGNVFSSLDGKNWYLEKESVPFPQISGPQSVRENYFGYYFAAREAAFLKFEVPDPNSCIFQSPTVKVLILGRGERTRTSDLTLPKRAL